MNSNHRGKTWLDRLSWFLTRHRLAVFIVVVIFTGIFSLGTLRIRTEVIIGDLFPKDHAYLKIVSQFSEVFGSGGSGAVVAVKAKNGDIFTEKQLSKVKAITEEIELWDEVYRILTKSMASRSMKVIKTLGRGEIAVVPLMWPELPGTEEEMDMLKINIFSNPAYKGTLVSTDGKGALIMTEFKENISYERAFTLLRGIVEKYEDDDTSIHIVGFPMLMGWIYSLKSQMQMVFVISIGLIFVILYVIFRNFVGMVAPLVVGLISTGVGLGFVGWTGINFSPLLFVLAFLVGARNVSHSVQITHRYLEEFRIGSRDKDKACYETMRSMIIPNVAGVVTDAAGFLVLFLAKIVLMQQIAVIMSFWMMSIAFSAILTPIICTYIPFKGNLEEFSDAGEKSWLNLGSASMTRFCIGSGKYLMGAVIIGVVIFCGWEMTKLKIGDPTPGSPLLWEDHRYNEDTSIINKHFNASSENLVLYYEGDPESVYDPIVLTTFEAFDRHMKEKLPEIYRSSDSLKTMTKMINLTFHDGDEAWHQLPTDRPLLSSVIGYVKMNMDISSFARYMDLTLERAQSTLFFTDHTSDNLLKIRDEAYSFFNDHSMETEKGRFKLAGGQIGMQIAVNEEMKSSHMKIDAMVLATIFIMCMICFRSIVAGLMLTIPLIIANMMAFAYMSMNGIGLSINTLPVAAVGAGVGVDFAIYMYSRCVEEYTEERGYVNTIIKAVITSGQAVIFTGLTMVLSMIPWYFLSELKFQAQMGFFLSMLLTTNVVLALTLHPLMIYVFKPKFIRKGRTLH